MNADLKQTMGKRAAVRTEAKPRDAVNEYIAMFEKSAERGDGLLFLDPGEKYAAGWDFMGRSNEYPTQDPGKLWPYTLVASCDDAYFEVPSEAHTMGKRLTQIATRTGDDGTTGLGDGQRVRKDSLRVQAMGDVDELNSSIGVLLAEPLPEQVRETLVEVQHQLFNLGGELSVPGMEVLKSNAVAHLDASLGIFNARLPKLQEFILPAGTRGAGLAHVCRTVARRAERSVVALGGTELMRAEPQQFLNRLSDLLFVIARVLNRMNGGDDVYWKSERLAREHGKASSKQEDSWAETKRDTSMGAL